MVSRKNILFIISFYFCTIANAQYTKLFDFTGSATGSAPFGSLISDGTSLYGMTHEGGTANTGAIFKINIVIPIANSVLEVQNLIVSVAKITIIICFD